MPPLLTFQAFSASTGPRTVLSRLDFSMRGGTPLVVLGPSGSGKTVLLRVLTGGVGDFSVEGQASLGGQPLSATHHAELVLRRPALLQGTIADAVNPDGKKGAVQLAVHALELHDFLHPLDRPMLDLAPFDVRLALLVREAILRPTVAAFDEPTYGLSEEETDVYCRTLRALAKRIGVVVATRNEHIADRLAGDLLVLDGGSIVRRALSPEVPSADAPKTRKKTFQTCDSYVPPSDGEGAGVIAIPPMAGIPRDSALEADGIRATSAFPAFVVDPDLARDKRDS